MKATFITTVLNEQATIEKLLVSIALQTIKPDEVIIVDGGSSDGTVAKIQNATLRLRSGLEFKIIIKRGNRSVGRNEAIKQATGDVILCSDAGCVLDKKWIESITKPFEDKVVDVVAGYYKGKPRSVFEKCLIPYVLVMLDRVNPDNFLPATRSMAFRKSIWKKVGGFPEEFAHNEDYVFARRLKEAKAKIIFRKDAIAYWIPRKNLWETFRMFFRFALGDAQAKILRPKVALLLLRYLIGTFLIIWFFIFKSYFILYTLYFILSSYILWSITKNYRYVNNWQAIFILPALQFTADFAVLIGTFIGLALNYFKSR